MIDINQVNMTTGELLKAACQDSGDKTYLYYIPREMGETFREYSFQVNQMSNLLEKNLKIKSGTKVCIMSDNTPESLHTISAVTNIGAVWVPINDQLIGEGLRYIVDESDASIICASKKYEDRLAETRSQIRRPLEIVRIEELSEKAKNMPREYESPAKPEDISVIMYTSSMTGAPKGAMHTNKAFVRMGVRALELLETTSRERIHVYLPLFHAWAYIITLGAIYFKATMYVDDKFNIQRYWEDIDKYQISQEHWTGTVPLSLMKLPETKIDKTRRMRVFGTFSSIYDSMKQRWPEMTFQSLYGQTEHPVATAVPPGQMVQGADGVPIPPDEIFILGENGERLPSGEVGEIVIRCRCGMRFVGYYKNPEATAETLKKDDLYTGDLGYLDSKGHLHFTGRKKDALRVRGEMLSIEHVERLIKMHPKIADCAIVGYRSLDKADLKEDEVVAHVVLKDKEEMTDRDFAEWTEQHLARFMRPKYLFFKDSLPKNATNQILRDELMEEGMGNAYKLF